MKSEKVEFEGSQGHSLAARLDLPLGTPRAHAIFAHCFSCSKDVLAASRISRELAREGIAVLRFDFTGLGNSDGDFANTNFSSNVEDIVAAGQFLEGRGGAPTLLIGHSLGGAAVISAAGDLPTVTAVAVIGAPSDASHVTRHFAADLDTISRDGEATVELAGRPFRIRKHFLDDLEGHALEDRISRLGRALLVLHSPVDELVGIDNATRIFVAARHPKSFVGLDGADHMLTAEADARFAAGMISAWARRYGAPSPLPDPPAAVRDGVVVQETGQGPYQNWVVNQDHAVLTDEPESVGGGNSGMTPYGFIAAALAGCTSMTLRMYANRKKWPLDRVTVTVVHNKDHADDCEHCPDTSVKVDIFERTLRIEGDLDADQRQRLLEIADRCPVHRTLHEPVVVRTRLES
ncbi:bifunctional alpha/beta hydrolase/OsmC family protein [Hyphobacterium marinum]|uniref:Bifunctional alpha/beta hydrolase/OsmC family protein n=1 Tax=Hyphobacterium marinum TaxID=3116574 RepID=A0ABU7M1N9_9PROT|nr:bifunctional alpha/beta hydrolase/OsmC family protein [Hyphobacterium sp. Y6023]MEE2567310.1 bifunctional alpha/beta hydrolase/OsmC family protein [Hyphobacterium sp. Y6023]